MDWETLGRRVMRQVDKKGREVTDKVKAAKDVFVMSQKKSEKEAELKGVYAAIGQIFFEEYEGEVDDEMTVMFCKVNELKAEIQRLEEELQSANPVVICPECGAELDAAAKFCSKCGASLTEEEE